MKAKRFTALLSVLALAIAVAVLGATASTAKATQKKGVTITIWDYFDAPPNGTAERTAMLKVANQWAKKTGNKVVDPGYVADKENKFIQAAPAGQGPDILMEPHDRLGSFAVPGLLAAAPKNLLSAKEKADYNPATLTAFSYGGKQYGLPWARETYFMFYNKDLVKSVPTTWGGVIQTAKKLTSGDQYGFLWDTTNFYYDYAFIGGYGGYVFKHTSGGLDPKQLGIDTPGSIKGLQLIQDLTNFYKLTPATTNTDVMEGKFAAGKVGMIIDGPWAVAGFKAKGVNFGVAGLPQFKKGSADEAVHGRPGLPRQLQVEERRGRLGPGQVPEPAHAAGDVQGRGSRPGAQLGREPAARQEEPGHAGRDREREPRRADAEHPRDGGGVAADGRRTADARAGQGHARPGGGERPEGDRSGHRAAGRLR